jgi:hypothetical protein
MGRITRTHGKQHCKHKTDRLIKMAAGESEDGLVESTDWGTDRGGSLDRYQVWNLSEQVSAVQ